MTNAVIKDNRPYCPACGCGEFEIKGYDLKGKDIVMTAKCRKCSHKYVYCVKPKIDKNIRYVKGEDD